MKLYDEYTTTVESTIPALPTLSRNTHKTQLPSPQSKYGPSITPIKSLISTPLKKGSRF